jgi:hypothetical protein
MAMMKKPTPKKPATKLVAPAKKTLMPRNPNAKPSAKKPMPLTGQAAIDALQRRTSPAGVKKAEAGAKKAIDKKYPGLYKATKEVTSKVNKAKESTTLSPKDKAGLKKGLEKIKADSKKKAKAEVQKRKAPDSNFIARM